MGNRNDHISSKDDFSFKVSDSKFKTTTVGPDDFIREKVIGKGSFGKVCLVRKRSNGEPFAMKILHKRLIIENEVVEEIKNELHLMACIHHRFIVKLFYAFHTQSRLFLIMEFVTGGDLGWHVEKDVRFEEERAVRYMSEVFTAVDYLHSKGIVHRDLKLQNILLTPKGHIKLTDFGLSTLFRQGKQKQHLTDPVGTVLYMAPEICLPFSQQKRRRKFKEGYDYKVDYWSCGICFYEMLYGFSPFDGEREQEIIENIVSKELRFPESGGVSKEAKSLIRKLLQKDPKKRLCDFKKIQKHKLFKLHGVDFRKLGQNELKIPSHANNNFYKTPSLESSSLYSPMLSPPSSFGAGLERYNIIDQMDKFNDFNFSASFNGEFGTPPNSTPPLN